MAGPLSVTSISPMWRTREKPMDRSSLCHPTMARLPKTFKHVTAPPISGLRVVQGVPCGQMVMRTSPRGLGRGSVTLSVDGDADDRAGARAGGDERVADHGVLPREGWSLRLIQKWLRAGVIEDGRWTASEEGSPQGASVSPLLANVYLHYVFDLWVQQWGSPRDLWVKWRPEEPRSARVCSAFVG